MSYQIAYFMWKTPLQSCLDNIRDLLEHLENKTLIHMWCFHRSTNWTWEWRLLTYLRIWDPSWSKPIVTPIIWLPMANWLLLITPRLLSVQSSWLDSTPQTSSSHVGPDRWHHSALHPSLTLFTSCDSKPWASRCVWKQTKWVMLCSSLWCPLQ